MAGSFPFSLSLRHNEYSLSECRSGEKSTSLRTVDDNYMVLTAAIL